MESNYRDKGRLRGKTRGLFVGCCLAIALLSGFGLCVGLQVPEADAADYATYASKPVHNGPLGYHTESVYSDVYHPAVTHTEDQGHYETVVVGYRCAECGAAK